MPHKNNRKSSTCLMMGVAALVATVSGSASFGAGERHEAVGREMARMHEMEMQSRAFGPSSQLRVVNVPASSSSFVGERRAVGTFGASSSTGAASPALGQRKLYTPENAAAPRADFPTDAHNRMLVPAVKELRVPGGTANMPALAGQRQLYTPGRGAAPGADLPSDANRIPTPDGREIYTPGNTITPHADVPADAANRTPTPTARGFHIPGGSTR